MKLFNKLKIATGLLLLTSMHFAIAAETGSALKADNMRFEPYADAKITGTIVRGESLNIIKKQGAWLQVKSKKSTGWVRLLSVKRGAAATSNNLAGLASGRAGTGQVVSTTGIRGLSEKELKAAKFNETEVNALEGYTQAASQGKQFANAGNLKTINFATIKAPQTNRAGAAK